MQNFKKSGRHGVPGVRIVGSDTKRRAKREEWRVNNRRRDWGEGANECL